jgi:hypothetical protein
MKLLWIAIAIFLLVVLLAAWCDALTLSPFQRDAIKLYQANPEKGMIWWARATRVYFVPDPEPPVGWSVMWTDFSRWESPTTLVVKRTTFYAMLPLPEPNIPAEPNMYIHHEDANDSFIETWDRLKPQEPNI